jgi:phosphomannomutase
MQTGDLGRRIREGRKSKDITQKELAAVLGISRTFVNKIEAEEEFPSQDLCRTIADTLGIPSLELCNALEQTKIAHSRQRLSLREKTLQGEIQSRSDRLIVGVSGLQSTSGSALTLSGSIDFVLAYASWLRKLTPSPTVLVGCDTTPTSAPLRHIVIAGLTASGCSVVDLGVVPIATLQIAIPYHKASGGICITASRAPAQCNTLKFFQADGLYLNKQSAQHVIDLYRRSDFGLGKETIVGTERADCASAERHIERVLSMLNVSAIRRKRFRVVLDCCCGAGGAVSPLLLQELGCDVIPINCKLSGIPPHPVDLLPSSLGQLCDAVRSHGADVGFAHDTDVDRVGIVTDSGEFLCEDNTLVWTLQHFLPNHSCGPIVVSLSTTMAVETVARRFKCGVYRTAVGDAHVTYKMKELGAVIGGEGNGGVIIPEISFARDGVATIALILESLALSNLTSTLYASRFLPRYHIRKNKVAFPRERMNQLLLLLKSWGQEARPEAIVDESDGLKLEWRGARSTRSWAHVRPSTTEPVVRITCESRSEEETACLESKILQKIKTLAEVL